MVFLDRTLSRTHVTINLLKFDFIYDGNFHKTKWDAGVSICTKVFFCFIGQNYLFNLSRNIELLKKNSELSIVNEFPRNNTLASNTLKVIIS